jgi:organic hydroperoxide reductase OsmC/OhrA
LIEACLGRCIDVAEEKEMITTLELLKGFEFRVKFDLENVSDLLMDEPAPVGKDLGPNASRVLSAAVGNCLSASLLFCLTKAKVNVEGMKTTVATKLARNEEGYWRVKGISVKIFPNIEEKLSAQMKRCIELFERYCIVTQSVRKGINVTVEILPKS